MKFFFSLQVAIANALHRDLHMNVVWVWYSYSHHSFINKRRCGYEVAIAIIALQTYKVPLLFGDFNEAGASKQ